MSNQSRFHQRCLLATLALAFVVRFAILIATWNSPTVLRFDSASYLAGASSLAHERSLQASGRPVLFRTPGYPLFLAMCGAAGPRGFGLAQAVQAALSLLLVFGTYKLAVRLAGVSAGLWAALLQALSMVDIMGSALIATDGLFTVFLIGAVYLLVLRFQQGRIWLAGAAGALTAAATYVRPVGIIFVPIAAMVLLLPRKGRLAGAICFVSAFAALTAPWYLRNYVETGYRGFASVGDFNLLFYEANSVWAKERGMPVLEARAELAELYRRELSARGIEACDPDSIQAVPCTARAVGVQREMAWRIILAHPLTFVYLHARTSLGSLLPESTELLQALRLTSGGKGTLGVLQTSGVVAALRHYFQPNPAVALLILPEIILLFVQYASGTAFALRKIHARSWSAGGALAALTIAAFLLVGGPAATARMRMPVEPLLNVAAGAGIAVLLERRTRASRRVGVSA